VGGDDHHAVAGIDAGLQGARPPGDQVGGAGVGEAEAAVLTGQGLIAPDGRQAVEQHAECEVDAASDGHTMADWHWSESYDRPRAARVRGWSGRLSAGG